MARPRFARLDAAVRRRILETAAAEFAHRGYDGMSLNALLEALELSKGSFYYYFDDKADLFATVVDFAFEIMIPAEFLDFSALDADTFWPALGRMMTEARNRAREYPWLAGVGRLVYDPPDVAGLRETLARKMNEARQWQEALIRHGQAVGAVRDDLPADLLGAMLVGADEAGDRWFVAHWERLGDDETDRLAGEVFLILRRMLETPGKRSA